MYRLTFRRKSDNLEMEVIQIMKIKALSLLITLCMVIGLVPAVRGTEGSGQWSDRWGHSLDWSYCDGVLTITGSGEMPWAEADAVMPWGDLPVTELVVAGGVTNVSDYAFRSGATLERVTLGDSVEWIGYEAFRGCSALEEVRLPEGLVYIDALAFRDCASLTAVVFPESLMEIGYESFYGCDLREVFLPEKLWFVEYGMAFGGNENLTRFVVDEANTDLESDSQGALYHEGMAVLLDVPGGFAGAYTMPATIRDFDEGYLFHDCAGLEAIHVEDGNARYYSIDGVLYGAHYDYVYDAEQGRYVTGEKIADELICYPPAKRDDSFTIAGGTTDMDAQAFRNCRYLTEVTIPVTCLADEYQFYPGALGSRFTGCTALEAVWFDGEHPVYASDDEGVVFNRMEFYEDDAGMRLGAGEALLLLPAGRTGYYAVPEGVRYLAQRSIWHSRLSAIRFPASLEAYGDEAVDHGAVEWMLFAGEFPREAAFRNENRSWNDLAATVYYPGWLESWQGCRLNEDHDDLTYVAYEQGREPVWVPENPFTDVPAGAFYEAPVVWAVKNGITNGLTATAFGPTAQCNRAQVVTFLWRAAGCPEPRSTTHNFVDVQTGSFYERAVLWALENGITTGADATHFNPNGACNRAQVVTFLYRAFGSPAVAVGGLPFTDVPAGSWYEAPVAWAVANNITNGLTATEFGPNSVCNRAQVVTFLYRAYAA